MSELAQTLGQASEEDAEPAHSLAVSLSEIKADHAIRDACIEASGKIRATKVPDLDRVLFGRQSDNDTASNAMRGLLLALGMSRQKANGMSPQPVRGHCFYHNVQNMWVCANPDCDEQEHRKVLSAYDGTAATLGPVGALHTQHRITCSCGGRVLDLLVCEVCGDILLGGYRGKADLDGQSVEILTADMPNLADMPSRVPPDRKYGQYAVFWPLAKDEMDSEPEDVEFSQNRIDRRWISAKLSVKSGRLTRTETLAGPDEIGGWIYAIGGSEADNQHALPAKCPRCDADYRRRQFRYAAALAPHRIPEGLSGRGRCPCARDASGTRRQARPQAAHIYRQPAGRCQAGLGNGAGPLPGYGADIAAQSTGRVLGDI